VCREEGAGPSKRAAASTTRKGVDGSDGKEWKCGNRYALIETLAERLRKILDAYTAFEADTHNAILAEDCRAVRPDGTVHSRKPTRRTRRRRLKIYCLRDFET